MAEFPALPLWTDAYLGDTTHLNVTEHGAYLLLLITAWRTHDCALPDDDRLLARFARCEPRQWKKLRPIIAQFFVIENGKWRQGKLTDVRETIQHRREKAASNGRASALKRQGRHAAKREQSVNGASSSASTERELTISISSSVDKSTGQEPADSDKVFWANAKAFLAPEIKGDPGKLVGAWCRDYGKQATADAITRAQLERPVECVPFIVGCLKQSRQSEASWDFMP